jgi:p-aminobenzoyl-glutamate transporter AbgT
MLTGIIQTLANLLKLKTEDVLLVLVIIIAIGIGELSGVIKRKLIQLLERSWKT